MPEGSDRREGMPFYLGAFLAVALDWRAQARNVASNTQALQALKEKVAALKEEKEALGHIDLESNPRSPLFSPLSTPLSSFFLNHSFLYKR